MRYKVHKGTFKDESGAINKQIKASNTAFFFFLSKFRPQLNETQFVPP